MMGIPRKRSRHIEVDGRAYLYFVKETHVPDHKDQKELSVTIQEDVENPGNVLQFRASWGFGITNLFIASAVKSALKQGWVPNKRGLAFTLTHL
jgi:hypothetical protein